MPTLYQSDYAKRVKTMPTPQGGEVLAVRGVVLAIAALAANDVAEAVILPADCVPVDLILDTDDLDTNGSPTITFDLGLMSGTAGANDSSRTVGNEFAAALTTPQAGGHARANKAQGVRILPAQVDRGIGVKVAAGAATGVASLTNLNVNRGMWQAATIYTANDFVTLPNGVRVKCTTGGTSGATNPFVGTTLYNATVTDNTVTWTIADPVIGVTLLYRSSHHGY